MGTTNNLPIATTAQELVASFNERRFVDDNRPTNEISLYDKVKLQTKEQAEQYYTDIHNVIESLVYAFSTCDKEGKTIPAHPYQFYTQLCKMIFENRMSIEHIKAAASHVIRHHKYTKFIMSDILDYDVRIKTYTKDDVFRLKGCYPSSDYPLVQFPDGREAIISLSDYNTHKVSEEDAQQIHVGMLPLTKAVMLVRDFKEYDSQSV